MTGDNSGRGTTRTTDEVAGAFVAEARRLLREDHLPRIERCLGQLDDEQVWWRPNDESNSVGNLLLHLEGNARQWIVSGLAGVPDTRARQSEFDAGLADGAASERPGGAQLLARLAETMGEVDLVLARLDPSLLLERRRFQNREEIPVLDAILHVVEHFSMHAGQIILLTKMLTARDLAFYDFPGGVPRHAWRE